MKTRFIVDLPTGAIRRTIEGVEVPSDLAAILYARDLLECEIQFFAGAEDKTDDVLVGNTATIGLRQFPSAGSLLAQSSNFDYLGSGFPATCSLNLGTAEIIDLVDKLPTQARSTRVYFEIEVGNGTTYRQTVAQQPFLLFCEVNMNGDQPPTLSPDVFTISKGESIPLMLTVSRDGNGDLLTSLDDYVIRVITVNPSVHGSEVLSKTTDNGSITVSGNTASWIWSNTETAAFPASLSFYVFLDDSNGISSVIISGIINTSPL